MKIGEDGYLGENVQDLLYFDNSSCCVHISRTAESFPTTAHSFCVQNASDTHLWLNDHFLGIVESRI